MQRGLVLFLALFSCVSMQASDIFQAIESKNRNEISGWLKSKPDINLLNNEGQTPLIVAVIVGNMGCVKALLKNGALINVVDEFGKTALDYAIELKRSGMVLKLVKKDAKVTSQSNLIKVKKVLRRRACLLISLSMGLLGFVGLFHYEIAMLPDFLYCLFSPLQIGTIIAAGSFATCIPGVYWFGKANRVEVV